MERIGVLTSGGDSPGMNAVLRAAVRTALAHGLEVIGIEDGYRGLLEKRSHPLVRSSVSDILDRGGTFLGAGRSRDFATAEGVARAAEILREWGVEGLVTIGGDGTLRGAQDLEKTSIACVGVPASIDNDVAGTDYCIGFDTALNTIIHDVDKIRDTAHAMDRIFVIEVMGRNTGTLALYSGLGCGADALIIPEVDFSMNDLVCRIREAEREDKHHFIVVVAEGAARGEEVGAGLAELVDKEVRVSVLGYIQRGGAPSALDRAGGSRLGARAVELLEDGRHGVMAGILGDAIVTVPLEEATATKRETDPSLYPLVMTLSP